jgi:VWFA-related protein
MRIATMAFARMAAAFLALVAGHAAADAAQNEKRPATLASIRVEGLASATPGVDVGVEPATGRVTVKIPAAAFEQVLTAAVRPGRLRVSEDGVPQQASIDVEHAPVSLAVLIELGGRSGQLTELLQAEAPSLVRPLFDRLGPNDRLGLFTYDRALRTVVDFGAPRDAWAGALDRLAAPVFSEANFYDAAVGILERVQDQPGRRAVILVTTGIDTFSRSSLADLLARARAADTPMYVLSLGDLVQHRIFDQETGPLRRVNWSAVERACERIAEASGGRAYRRVRPSTVASVFDDVLERLRVTYVLSYVSQRIRPDDRRAHLVEVRLAPAESRSPARGASQASG